MSWAPWGSLPLLLSSPSCFPRLPPRGWEGTRGQTEAEGTTGGRHRSAEGSHRGLESKEPRTGDWGRPHGLEAVGHMTMTSPSHQPLLPSTQAPPRAEELPGAAAGAGTGLQDRGGYLRLPPTFLQVPPPSLPTSPLPAQPRPALGFPGLLLAHHPSLPVQLWHALLLYLRACVYLLLSMYPCADLPDGAGFRCRDVNCPADRKPSGERAAPDAPRGWGSSGGRRRRELLGEP